MNHRGRGSPRYDREAGSDQSQTPARKGGGATYHALPARPRPEGSDLPRPPSAASPGGKRPTTSSQRVLAATSDAIERGIGDEWLSDLEPVAARTHWEGVVALSPPGEAALGGRGRSLHRADEGYVIVGVFTPGERARAAPFDAVEVDLDELFVSDDDPG